MKTCKNCQRPIMKCPMGEHCEFKGWIHDTLDDIGHVCDADKRLVAEPGDDDAPR